MEPSLLVFRPFIPGTRRKAGNAGLSAKELRDRKRKRLEREHELHHATTTQVTPLADEEDDEHVGNSTTTDPNCEILVSPCVEDSSKGPIKHPSEHTDETLRMPNNGRPFEPPNLLPNLPVESSSEQPNEIREKRSRLQTHIQQMQDRRTELSHALEHERIELQRDEQTHAELQTDLAGFQETLHHIQSRRKHIETETQRKRAELVQLQAMVEEMRKQTVEAEQVQKDCMQEIDHRARELERERSSFADAMQKATANIARLRETAEKLQECQRKEADARAATLAAAKHAVSTGKLKVSLLLSDNSQNLPSTSELKTVYWKPHATDTKTRRKTKERTRLPGHDALRHETAVDSESESNDRGGGGDTTSNSMEVHATPVQHRTPRRHVDLKLKVDSLSRLGDESVNNNERKLSSAEKKNEYGSLRKQLMNDGTWNTDSLAVSSHHHENGSRNSSPPSLTYMGHEILRKRRRPSTRFDVQYSPL